VSKLLPLSLAFALLGGAEGRARAADDARAIVDKAIKAQGGEAKLAKLKRARVKVVGKLALGPGKPDAPFVITDVWQMPRQYKTSLEVTADGKKLSQTLVLNGDKGWASLNGETKELPKEALAEMKEQKYAEDLDRLLGLKDKGVTLTVLKEAKVNGKPAVGVAVKAKGHRDVKLYFDKASGLLVKREHKVVDDSGKEVLQEVIFDQYEDVDGVKHYKKIAAYRAGKKFVEGKVTSVSFPDKMDDKEFDKP
jgi:hypothetical protein